MRRALAAALLGISLWIGSLAWSGFLMTRTVLDPQRSEQVADALLEDETVRAQLEANIAGSIAAAVPEDAPVDRASVDAAAAAALDSPATEAIFRDALVRTHQAFLGEGETPRSVDGGSVGSSARDALVTEHPALEGALPAARSFEVPLPTERVPNLGPVRRFLVAAVPVLAAAAAVGALLALLVTTNRPAVVRRAGVWAVGLSAIVLAFAYGVPATARELAPDQAEVVAALVGALAATTRGPALVLAGAGLAGIVGSFVWGRARIPDPAPVEAVAPVVERRRRERRPTRTGPVTHQGPGTRPGRRRDVPTPARRPAPAVVPTPRPVLDHTRVTSSAVPDATRVDQLPDRGGPDVPRDGARWVDGVGWVHHGPDPVPPGARWVPGVGYVLAD